MKTYKYKTYDFDMILGKDIEGKAKKIPCKLAMTIMGKSEYEITIIAPKTLLNGFYGIGNTKDEAFDALIEGLILRKRKKSLFPSRPW